jgi:hypothetical protein
MNCWITGWLRLMSKINSFYKLSSLRKGLFIESIILMIFIRLFLSLISFSRVKKISDRLSRPNNNQKDPVTIEDIVWCVQVVSVYVPRATCLTQAITAQILLFRHNHPSKLKIGVYKGEEFEAHAWLEINNKIVLGKSEQKYIPILESE